MRALRRIATPASVAVVLTACTHDLDDYYRSARTDAGLATNGDAAAVPNDDATTDAATDACYCVKEVQGKCKEWSSVACAR